MLAQCLNQVLLVNYLQQLYRRLRLLPNYSLFLILKNKILNHGV